MSPKINQFLYKSNWPMKSKAKSMFLVLLFEILYSVISYFAFVFCCLYSRFVFCFYIVYFLFVFVFCICFLYLWKNQPKLESESNWPMKAKAKFMDVSAPPKLSLKGTKTKPPCGRNSAKLLESIKFCDFSADLAETDAQQAAAACETWARILHQ